MSRQHRVTWLMAALICAFASIASAQSGTSTLQGKVLDAQKAALPGATATLANAETGFSRETVSDATGAFVFSAVPPGTYSLSVALTGFKTSVADKVTLQVDTVTELNVGLEIGSLAESIQVSAEAPVINTSDASIGNVISGNQIRQLPLEGRNVVGLLSLQPGVTYIPKADPGATMDPRYGSVSGARADQSTVTLDGIDVNDQDRQTAFTSVLRVTLDSVQEFRVTTSNYGADQGRSSGAQVSLVTRSGTNDYHGAGYYVNRNTAFSSNEYFLKLSQLAEGEESKPPKLDKNIYGFSLGGPIRRDKLFFFGNFEGLNDSRETVVTRAVPSDSLRDGVLMYQCANPAQCPGGTVQGLTGSHPVPAGSYGMSPADVARVDPLHIGPSLAASQYFKQFPSANTEGRYPGNIDDFRFAAPAENRFRTYIFRGDYRLNGQNSFFGRLNKQDDTLQGTPQYPGNDPNRSRTDKNWGTALGWDSTFGGNVVNTFRYGYTKIDSDTVGLQHADFTSFRFIDSLEFDVANGGSFDNGRNITTHNFVDDVSMVKGRHTLKFGGNMRLVRNDNYTFANSYITGSANGSWVAGVGRRYRPGGACPPPGDCSGLPAVASTSISSYGDSIIPLLGVISQTNVVYNNTIDGQILGGGTPVNRLYGANEFELYAQDSWHVSDNLTVSAGIRYGLYSPPWEVNGQQVATTFALGEWFEDRAAGMQNGVPSNASPQITFVPGGPANDAPGYYEWDKNNFAPRVSAAWTPSPTWVVRGGYGLVYDRIGAGLASTFDTFGSFGLSNNLDSPFGGNNETNPAVRFTSTSVVPATYPDAPPTGFPATPEVDTGAITSSLDQSIKTPYSHVFNIIVGKELGRSYGIEAGYVGRRGRSLLVRRDIAMPLNLTDPASGIDYFTAARQLVDAYNAAGGDVALIARQPYWENLFPDAAFDGLTATQNMAAEFGGNAPDYITALYNLDKGCFPACSRFGPNSFFGEQYDSLAAQSSLGYSDYDALQLTLRRRYSQGYQFDLNYTLARGRDNGSQVERGSAFDNFGSGGYSGFLVNSFDPDQNYSYSDFDVRHQINVNWLAELPFGQGKHWGSGAGTAMNAIIGDWAVSGIGRWSSGYPFNVINCRSCWATNWNLQGNAALAQPGVLPELQTTRDAVGGQPSPFADPQDALTFFRNLYPGEAGIRNELRGDGYFTIDLSIAKGFRLPSSQKIEFRWDIFNLTNTPKFDTGDVTMFPDSAASFGRYDSSLAACDGAAGRCMQLNLRYTF